MGKIHAVITGVGGYVPTYILDNDEMSHIVETSDEWIMERIGVKTRHILKPEEGRGTSYLMTRAVRQLLKKMRVVFGCLKSCVISLAVAEHERCCN